MITARELLVFMGALTAGYLAALWLGPTYGENGWRFGPVAGFGAFLVAAGLARRWTCRKKQE